MKPSHALNLSARILLSLTLLLVCPLLLPAQSKDKKSNPPPSPPPQQQQRQQRPQPQQQPQRQQPQTQQQRPANPQQSGGNAGRSTTGAANSANAGRSATGAANSANVGRSATGAVNNANAGRGATGAANSANAGRGATGTGNTGNGGRGATGAGNVPAKVIRPDGGTVERRTDGSSVERDKNNRVIGQTTREGHRLEYSPTGHPVKVVTNKGTEARFDTHGKVSTIKTSGGMTINREPNGQRRIVTEHRDANNHFESRVVTAGPNRGFVERRFERGGHEYVRRTYVYEGRTNVAVYRTYYYNNVAYYHYVPAYYYAPVYYGWAYNPWPAPAYYTWGWYGDPWYRPYGYYFAPYPVYPSADFWLTDYLIAENLRASYQAQGAANVDAAAANADAAAANANAAAANAGAAAAQRSSQAGAVTLTPEVKQMIAEEVKAQLAAEQAAATQNVTASATPTSVPAQPAGNTDQVPPALDPNLRVFIVTTSLDVTANGQSCSLSAGDVLSRMDNLPDSNNTVGVMVLSSKKSDCGMDSWQRVQVADLQEMHNRFREQLDTGLKTLADNQGKKGIPSGPAAGGRKNPDGTSAPDDAAVVATKLKQQQQEADQTEKEVQQATSSPSGTGGNN
jgi:hypothetical protein